MTASTMTKKTARKAKSVSKAALGRYLAAGLGATGLATAESEAAIVTLNVAAIGETSPGSGVPVDISGVNAGIDPGLYKLVYNLGSIPVSPYSVFAVGNTYPSVAGDLTGLVDFTSVRFANGGSRSTPKIFTEGQFVDSSASNNWGSIYNAAFKTVPPVGSPSTAPSITGPGNYMGFRVGTPSGPFNYGYFEVTWDSTTEQFQILSGAYESTPNTPIAVPEPATMALAGIGALALGAGAIRRSRKARKAAAEGTLAEAV
jgi:hypothetical protein